jgi:site-specific DNA recombinase
VLEEHPHPNPSKALDGRKKHRLIIDPVRAPIVRQIYCWYCHDALGLGEIVDRLNRDLERYPAPKPNKKDECELRPTWSRSSIQAILRNPKYTGFNVWNRHDKRRGKRTLRPETEWKWSSEPTHPGIIEKELFDLVPAAAGRNTNVIATGGAKPYTGGQRTNGRLPHVGPCLLHALRMPS